MDRRLSFTTPNYRLPTQLLLFKQINLTYQKLKITDVILLPLNFALASFWLFLKKLYPMRVLPKMPSVQEQESDTFKERV